MNAFVVRGLYVHFYFDNSKVFVFVDAHGVRVYEDTIDVSLCFIEISCYYYSGTSLKRTPTGQKLLSALERCPPWRGLN